jgi:hypothetical protein
LLHLFALQNSKKWKTLIFFLNRLSQI